MTKRSEMNLVKCQMLCKCEGRHFLFLNGISHVLWTKANCIFLQILRKLVCFVQKSLGSLIYYVGQRIRSTSAAAVVNNCGVSGCKFAANYAEEANKKGKREEWPRSLG